MTTWPNQPAAGNAGFAPRFQTEHRQPGVAEPVLSENSNPAKTGHFLENMSAFPCSAWHRDGRDPSRASSSTGRLTFNPE
jgi:hypothetical protein